MEKETPCYAVIMAGGRSERFWPKSRLDRPKQLLKLLGNVTMLEQTMERLRPLFPPERIVIATNCDYAKAIHSLLPEIPEANILSEPCSKNTAPCIAMAMAYISTVSGCENPTVAVFSADHVIKNKGAFRNVVQKCLNHATASCDIVTIGIAPTYAATGYGYIQTGQAIFPAQPAGAVSAVGGDTQTSHNHSQVRLFSVLDFKEKPDSTTATKYLNARCYLWNSGMFFMSLKTFEHEIHECAPGIDMLYSALHNAFRNGDDAALVKEFENTEKISIDYALMEKTSHLAVAEAVFDWDDVGTWESMRNHFPTDENGNVVNARNVSIDTRDSILFSDDKDHLIATLGLDDTVVVHTDDVTLVCSARYAQKIGSLLKVLRTDDKNKRYL